MDKKIAVLKFGGTSMGSFESVNLCCDIIIKKLQYNNLCVVVSAMSGVTNLLVSAVENAKNSHLHEILKQIENKHKDFLRSAFENDVEVWNECFFDIFENLKKQFLKKIDEENYAYILSHGERFSAILINLVLEKRQIETRIIDPTLLINIDGNEFKDGICDFIKTQESCKNNLLPVVNEGIVIVSGFYGINKSNKVALLGRGGSDYSASIIGSAIKADRIEIWTDVDGIMTADPRIIKNASSMSKIDFTTATEMAYAGAKVIHPKTTEPAMFAKVKVVILNTFNQDFHGTEITFDECSNFNLCIGSDNMLISTEIGSLQEVDLMKNVSSILSDEKIQIKHCSRTETNFIFYINKANYSDVVLKKIKEKTNSYIKIIDDLVKVSIIGRGACKNNLLVVKILDILKNKNVEHFGFFLTNFDYNLSFFVKKDCLDLIINDIHNVILTKID